MPTDVAMSRFDDEFLCQEASVNSTETKSGSVTLLVSKERQQRVTVIVHKTTLEHFAVLYPQKKICRPLGVLNLKNARVQRLVGKQTGFQVHHSGFDSPMWLSFLCEPKELNSWMEAFENTPTKTLRHQSSLPIVEEEE